MYELKTSLKSLAGYTQQIAILFATCHFLIRECSLKKSIFYFLSKTCTQGGESRRSLPKQTRWWMQPKVGFSLLSLKFVMFLCKGTYNNLLHNFPSTQDFISWCFVPYVIWNARHQIRSEKIFHRFDRGNVRLLLSNSLFLLHIIMHINWNHWL
jgi:hypothetical protein